MILARSRHSLHQFAFVALLSASLSFTLAAHGEPTASPPSESASRSAKALVTYQQGDAEAAAQLSLDNVTWCDSVPRAQCTDAERAIFFRDLGIVYAGGLSRRADAVGAFREALRLDPSVQVPASLQIAPVNEAMSEAKGDAPALVATAAAKEPSSAPEPAQAEPRASVAPVAVVPPRPLGEKRKDGLYEGYVWNVVRFGGVARGGAFVQLGADLEALILPWRGPFGFGFGGALLSSSTGVSAVGMGNFFGSMGFAWRSKKAFRPNHFGYLTAKFGAQATLNEGGVWGSLLQFTTGGSIRGFDIGGDLAFNFFGGNSYPTAGLHLGFALGTLPNDK